MMRVMQFTDSAIKEFISKIQNKARAFNHPNPDSPLMISTVMIKQVMDERDEAVDALESIMYMGSQNVDSCQYCTYQSCYARGGSYLCNPRWRGRHE